MKKTLIISCILIVFAGGALLYLKLRKSTDFEPLIKAKLQQIVKDGSNGLYNLEIGKIDIDVLQSKVNVTNARLLIDSARLKVLDSLHKAPVDVYKISLQALSIDGLSPTDFLRQNNITLTTLHIKEPLVEVFHPLREKSYVAKDTFTLYQRVAKNLGHFEVKHLMIQKMDFSYHNFSKKDKVTQFKDVSMNFDDLVIDSSTQYDTTRFFYAKDAFIYLQDYSIATSDGLYNFGIDSLAIHASQGEMRLNGLTLQPKGKKEDFSKKLSYYKDRYDVKVSTAVIKKVNWWNFLTEEGFAADEMELTDGQVEIFADRSIPASKKIRVGNYPHQLLMKLNPAVYLPIIKLNNFKVVYKEYNLKSHKTGSLVFDDINGKMLNVTNDSEHIARNHYFILDATSSFMNKGPLHVKFGFNLSKAFNGVFSLDVDLGNMNGKDFNAVTIPLGLFDINGGVVKRVKMHMDAGNYHSKGIITFLYDDLKISILEEDDDEPGKVKQKGFMSFLANTIVIRKSNPEKGKPAVVSTIHVKRDPYKSFFNLIWITLREGLKKTVIS